MKTSEDCFSLAKKCMPGGVNSPVRAFQSVGGVPRFIQRAKGSRLWDIENNEYIDYIGSWGAMIAGHLHPHVVKRLHQTLEEGMSFGTPCALEIELAERILSRVPSVEKIRMVNSGTEAVMSAIRLARAFTGREKIVKLAGCYHGHADPLLVKAGSGVATLGLPDSAGVPASTTAQTISVPYNDISAMERVFEQYGKEIACVLLEPVAGNMGVVAPQERYLLQLRELTTQHGALLVLDEVMTGFRLGMAGAQGLYGVEADITTFGKIIGGGVPAGAYGGRKDIMQRVAPEGNMYQAGTLSGNPLAMASGIATLELLNEQAYQQLEEISASLQVGLESLLHRYSKKGCVQRVGSMLTLFWGVESVSTFEDAKKADHNQFAKMFHSFLQSGIHLPPSGYEAWFLSLAHTAEDIAATLEAFERFLKS